MRLLEISKLEIKVAPWGEGELKVNGKNVSRVDNAKDRRQAFRQLADTADKYLKEQAVESSSRIRIPTAKAKLLEGKRGLIVGIANEQSIAWGCAKAFRAFGAEVAVTYLNDKAKKYVEPLAHELQAPIFMPLDVSTPGQMEAVFERLPRNGASSISWCTRSPFRRRRRCRAASLTCRARAFSPRWTCPAGRSSAWPIWRSR